MDEQDDLDKKIVKLLTSHSIKEKRKGCNLAINQYSHAIFQAIKYRYSEVAKEDAEDIAQKVCIEFFLNVIAGKYEHRGKIEGYLRTIAKNQTSKFLDKRKRNLPDDLYMHYQLSDTPDDAEDYFRKDSYDKSRVDLFYKCVEQLPKNLLDIYNRYYEDDQRVKDIAAALNLSESAVKVHLYNLRNLLKNCVANQNFI